MVYDESLAKITWDNYISGIVDELDKSNSFKAKMKEILKPIPKLTVSNYKNIYIIEAEGKWNQFKSDNRDLFSSLFQRIYKDLEVYGYDYVEKHYYKELKLIVDTLDKDYNEIKVMLITLQYYLKNENTMESSKIKEQLKQYYKRFVILYKKSFIDDYVNKKLESIKKNFVRTEVNSTKKTLSINEFINILKSKKGFFEIKMKELNNDFNVDLNESDFENLIINMMDDNKDEVNSILNIKKPSFYDNIEQMKALKRLRNNWEPRIKKSFPKELFVYIQEYLNNKDRESLKSKFTKGQLKELDKISDLMKQCDCVINVYNDEWFVSECMDYTNDLKEIVTNYENTLLKLKKFKNNLSQIFNEENKLDTSYYRANKNDEKTVEFNDLNYRLKNYNYIFDTVLINKFLNNIDEEKLLKLNNFEFEKLKEILVSDSLLAPLLYSDDNQIDICDLINNFHDIYQNLGDIKFNRDNLYQIFKKCKIYKYATAEQISVLGLDVVEKIINNNQFIGVKVTDEDIKERLIKAVDLMNRAENVEYSTVPFNCDVESNGVRIERYMNNDPGILTSGIDTNSCFKLSANDNDLLYYCVLNKNGFVLKFLDKNNKLIGKAVCFRRNNILEINSIRNSENSNLISSKEQYNLYNEMLNAIDIYAQKIIDETSNSDNPIDFVVVNKAGILESSEFNDRYELLADHLFSNAIDNNNDDWQDFVHTFDGCAKNYLQQASEREVFTTDYGSYPVVMIKARDKMRLERLFDISYDDPKPIYKRPENTYVDDEEKRKKKIK